MAFRTHPQNPVFQSEGEKSVYGRLIDQLPDDAEVYCNVEHFDGRERREIDFLVAIPEFGLVALEVKGGKVVVDGNSWKQWDIKTKKLETKSFAYQLDAERRMIQDRFRQKFSRPYPTVAFLLVTPDSDFAMDSHTPGIERWQLVAANEKEQLYPKMLDALKRSGTGRKFEELEQDLIRSMFGDDANTYAHIVETSAERGLLVDELSAEQSYLLDLMSDNKRIFVKGGPGSGKTILAIEQAMRLASDGSRVGLLCYNRGLGEFLKRAVAKLDQDKKPKFVGNILDDLVARWGIQGPPVGGTKKEVSNYYQEFLPNALLEHASGLQDHQKFDAWIVDEAQDLQEPHWQLLKASLRDPENGIIHVFGDKEQNLFVGAKDLPWFYAIGRLNRNLRSSRAIASSLNEFSQGDNEPSGLIQGMSPEILLVDHRDQAEQSANEYVKFLISDAGWRPQDIVVIATRQRHAIHEALHGDPAKYWDSYFANDSVFYTHVSSFKGLERPVVVVVVNGIPSGTQGSQQLYVAMSRARDDLVLVGAAEELGHLGELFNKFPRAEL
jgi:hypothetical protein